VVGALIRRHGCQEKAHACMCRNSRVPANQCLRRRMQDSYPQMPEERTNLATCASLGPDVSPSLQGWFDCVVSRQLEIRRVALNGKEMEFPPSRTAASLPPCATPTPGIHGRSGRREWSMAHVLLAYGKRFLIGHGLHTVCSRIASSRASALCTCK
jgi:hypothetical protein